MTNVAVYRKPRTVTEEEWREGYNRWLKDGWSWNDVGDSLGLRPRSRLTVINHVKKLYGSQATDRWANSFLRSLHKDYPHDEWVNTLQPVSQQTSQRFLNVKQVTNMPGVGRAKLTGNRSNEMSYRIAYQESITRSDDPWDSLEEETQTDLLLPGLIFWLSILVSLLNKAMRDSDELQETQGEVG